MVYTYMYIYLQHLHSILHIHICLTYPDVPTLFYAHGRQTFGDVGVLSKMSK